MARPSAALACALMVVMCASAAAKIVNKARTQELFHTPYREEDSRHFKVNVDLRGAPRGLSARSLCGCPPGLLRAPRRSCSDVGLLAQIEDSATFHADAEKRFDLSYADGSELKGFNAHDIVHVRLPPFLPSFLHRSFPFFCVWPPCCGCPGCAPTATVETAGC